MLTTELSIIIVNWHSTEYVLKCVRSIRKETFNVSYEVIVVDNASFDGCDKRLHCQYPDVTYVQSNINLGFARANNLGVRYAHGSVLLFLNPDTEIQDQAIESLYSCFQKLPNVGVLGCRLLNSDKTIQMSCVQKLPTVMNQVLETDLLQRWFPKSSLWGIAALFEDGATPVEVEAISGACMMLHRSVFESVGGFTSDYFMYTEDIDLCFKTRRAGFSNYYFGKATIVHHGGGSSQQKRSDFSNIMVRESVSLFLRKSRGRFYSNCYKISLSGVAVIRLAMLGATFPVWLILGRTLGWKIAFLKWFAILRWGIGFEHWTKKYSQIKPENDTLSGTVEKTCVESAEN